MLCVDHVDQLDQVSSDVIANLIRGVGVEDLCHQWQQLIEVREESLSLSVVQEDDSPEQGTVLEIILRQGHRREQNGKDLVEGDGGWVLKDQTGDGTNGIVSCVEPCGRRVNRDVEQWTEGSEEVKILGG